MPPPAVRARHGFLHDTWVIARRGLLHMRRQPEALSDATIQPIMFVLLFAYVFGGAIPVIDGSYREFLMGGIFAQTIVFTAFGVALSLANDRKNNAVDRFRSLPIAKGALLGGHAVANLLKSLLPIILMSICGLIIGWRIRSGVGDAVRRLRPAGAFAFAMIWVGVLLGSVVATPEGVTGIAFVALFPLTFVASTFVPLTRRRPTGRTRTRCLPCCRRSPSGIRSPRSPTPCASSSATRSPTRAPDSRGRSRTRSLTRRCGRSASSSSCAPIAVRLYDRSIKK